MSAGVVGQRRVTVDQRPKRRSEKLLTLGCSNCILLKIPAQVSFPVEQRRYLRCLGQPALLSPAGELVRFRTKKHLALLIYIAVETRSHRRDRLAELLWPKVSPTEARHSLATALSTLRPRLGPDGLETSRDHVRLAPGRVTLDLERLETGDVLGNEVTERLEVAPFLEGFDVPDSSEFSHWKDRQQARLLPLIKDALLVLIDRCRRTGDTRQIERLADRMLVLDELSEEAIRAKMEARAFAGDRLTALEIFEDWKTKLAEELQAVPSDLVEGMAVRLRRRGWERSILPKIPNVPTDQWRGRPFVGRAAEYRMLYDAWEDVRRGIPRHAMILGDSGVGKSTLVERFTTAAGLQGAAISRVQCYDLEREIPYSTLSCLVSGLMDRPGVSATSPDALAELSRTVPEIRRRFPNLPLPSDSQGETTRIRLTEAALEMLRAIAEEHPVILVVDDLHLADDISLAVLHLIMRRVGSMPIMVILLARSGEITQSPPASKLRESGSAMGVCEVDLAPLTVSESEEMLSSLLPTDQAQPGPAARRALLRAAAGYPMVLELLVQDWQHSGEQSLALSMDSMTEGPTTETAARLPYRQILERMTRSLDATTHNVLNLASVLGQRLNDLTMYAVVDLSVGQTMSGMAELVRRRVLRDGAQGLEFVNEIVRASAYLGVPVSMRRILHSRIADRLIEEHSSGQGDLGLAIAWHCVRAGRHNEATPHLLRGAREAIRTGAVHAAEKALSTAAPHLGGAARVEASVLLAEVLQEQGRWGESLELLLDYGNKQSDTVVVLTITAQYWINTPSREQIIQSIAELVRVIDTTKDLVTRVKAALITSTMLAFLRDTKLAEAVLQSVSRIPSTNLTLDELACLAECKARLLYTALERAPCLSEVVAVASQLESRGLVSSTIGRLHIGLGAVACCEGRYEDAKREFQRSYDVFAGLGNETYLAAGAAQIALCCLRLGEYERAVEWGTQTTRTFGPTFSGYLECIVTFCIGFSLAMRGDARGALEITSRLDSRIPPTAPPWVLQAWGLHKADILFLLGDRSRALLAGKEAVDIPPVLESSFFAGPFCRWLALSSEAPQEVIDGRICIQGMLQDLDKFDALDRVEVLCASMILAHNGQSTDERRRILTKKLAELPDVTTKHLIRLGMPL
jgi:DNA-binding SARP family transcriptional activator